MRSCFFYDEHHAERHGPADQRLERAFYPQHTPRNRLRYEAPCPEAASQRIDHERKPMKPFDPKLRKHLAKKLAITGCNQRRKWIALRVAAADDKRIRRSHDWQHKNREEAQVIAGSAITILPAGRLAPTKGLQICAFSDNGRSHGVLIELRF
jgi:hypothetical protein